MLTPERGLKLTGSATQDSALLALLRAIASHDLRRASQLLEKSPTFAAQALKVGATREDPNTCYFKEIEHYAYAGDTPLHIAAAAYQYDLAQQLVSSGANVSAKNRRGAEPIHYASDGIPGSQGWNPDAQVAIVTFLIDAGANPNSLDTSGVGPLHRAVRTRCAGAVRALLIGGADARRANRSGSTPLHLAVQSTGRGGTGSTTAREQQEQIIRLLLERGARSTDKDAKGKPVKDSITAEWIRDLFTGLD